MQAINPGKSGLRAGGFPRLNKWLVLAGSMSILAGMLHIAIIIGGAAWYRYFGAGEDLAGLAEQGSMIPGMVTAAISAVLFIWGLYAYSGAGLTRPLPWLRASLAIISVIYLLRGLAVIPAIILRPEVVDAFLVWSSAVSFLFGLSYAIGTRQMLWEHS